jgi:hypothetical protein
MNAKECRDKVRELTIVDNSKEESIVRKEIEAAVAGKKSGTSVDFHISDDLKSKLEIEEGFAVKRTSARNESITFITWGV